MSLQSPGNNTVFEDFNLFPYFKYATDAKADVSITTFSLHRLPSLAAAGNTANHPVSRAALCLLLQESTFHFWHLEKNFILRHRHMVIMWLGVIKNFSTDKTCSHKGTDLTICRVLTTPHFAEWSSCGKLLACFTPHSVGGKHIGRLRFKWTVIKKRKKS